MIITCKISCALVARLLESALLTRIMNMNEIMRVMGYSTSPYTLIDGVLNSVNNVETSHSRNSTHANPNLEGKLIQTWTW